MSSRFNLLVSLFKLRASFAIAATAVVGMASADGPPPSWSQCAGITLAVLGASCATGAFNHYYERHLDRLMRRTRERPFASGVLQSGWHWPAAFAALLLASLTIAVAACGVIAAGYVFLGAFAYAIVYTVWLKRRSAWNIVAGALGGSFVVLAGAATVDPAPHLIPSILAVAVFLWALPHFWTLAAARSDDYRSAGIPMLPNVVSDSAWTIAVVALAAALVGVSLIPLFAGFGLAYGFGATVGGVLLLWKSWQLHQVPGRQNAIATFLASLVQLGLLYSGVVFQRAVTGWG